MLFFGRFLMRIVIGRLGVDGFYIKIKQQIVNRFKYYCQEYCLIVNFSIDFLCLVVQLLRQILCINFDNEDIRSIRVYVYLYINLIIQEYGLISCMYEIYNIKILFFYGDYCEFYFFLSSYFFFVVYKFIEVEEYFGFFICILDKFIVVF